MAATDKIRIKTPIFRGSFVNLIKPKKSVREDGTEKENYQMLIPLKKSDPATKAFIKELMDGIAKVSAAKHGTAIPIKRLKNCPIKDGDTFDNEDFHGHWCINVAANYRPQVCDKHGEILETTDDVYSGAWYKAMLSPWAYSNKFGKGVSINIESAVKVKDDARLGGGSNAAEDFADDISEGGDDGLSGGSDSDDLEDLLG